MKSTLTTCCTSKCVLNGEEKLLLQQKLGWTEAALVAGARDAGLSPAIVGSFPRKDAALVEVTKLL
jgi:hypothetical protein